MSMKLSFHIEPLAIVVAFSVLQRAWGTPPKYMDDSRSTEGKNYQAEYVKEYVRDESNFIVEANAHGGRLMTECGEGERVLYFNFTTDQYGYETSFIWWREGGDILDSGPATNGNFLDRESYSYQYCVRIGESLRLKMVDRAGDGLCCAFGLGTYSFSIDGETLYDSNYERTFTNSKVHTFRVDEPLTEPETESTPFPTPTPLITLKPTKYPTRNPRPRPTPSPTRRPRPTPSPTRRPRPTPNPTKIPVRNRPTSNQISLAVSGRTDGRGGGGGGGGSGSGCINVVVKADKQPDELSWSIINKNGKVMASNPQLKALTPVSKRVCLPPGEYEFVMKDKFGDGISPRDGNFVVSMDGREILRGAYFRSEKRYKLQVSPPYTRNMSARDREWLDSHNTRRKKYHREFGASYVPLQWSPQLARDAKRWATKLLDDCDVSGIEHEKNVKEGENLAKNRGSGKYGELYPTENILNRWVEKERYLGYPRNAHLTQCLWRSTQYVGCGEAVKPFNGGRGTCRIQVCRYSTAGNCNMNQYKAYIGNNWIKPMMESNSKCGPECPPEGCGVW